jgi:hypothetical protein
MSVDAMCEPFVDNLAELALGTLTGRERIATLGHVDSCAQCASELEHLSRASDAILQMAPDVEPPPGFEARLRNRMANEGVRTPRRALHRWVLAGAAAVIALGLGLSIGLSVGAPPSRAKVATPRLLQTASLIEDGNAIGGVSLYGGSSPVLTMDLTKSSVQGTVTCEIVTDSGTTHKLGTFKVTNGYGVWAAPLGVPPNDVRAAQLLSPEGATIARATLG